MQDGRKAVWSIPYVSVAFFPSLKQNFIAYRSSKGYWRPDCIFEIHQLWQSGFSRVYSNSCRSSSFEPEIIKIGQSSHKMYSNHHHHHVVTLARISLTLSCHFSLSFIASGWSSRLHPISSHSCCMYVRAGRTAFAWPYAGVHRSASLMSSFLLLQQCPACLVRLTESKTILDTCTKKSGKILKAPRIYSICVYKQDLALNNLQILTCHKTKPN